MASLYKGRKDKTLTSSSNILICEQPHVNRPGQSKQSNTSSNTGLVNTKPLADLPVKQHPLFRLVRKISFFLGAPGAPWSQSGAWNPQVRQSYSLRCETERRGTARRPLLRLSIRSSRTQRKIMALHLQKYKNIIAKIDIALKCNSNIIKFIEENTKHGEPKKTGCQSRPSRTSAWDRLTASATCVSGGRTAFS